MTAVARMVEVGGPPEPWSALGFDCAGGVVDLGAVTISLTGGAGGIGAVLLSGLGESEPDGLPLQRLATDPPCGSSPRGLAPADHSTGTEATHPNGACAVDHVVALTDDLSRTTDALERAGLPERRRAGDQAFFNLSTLVLEVVQVAGEHPRLWGVTIVVSDLDATIAAAGDRIGAARAAVQPGRRIATVRAHAGLGTARAFMTPRVRTR